MSGIFFNTTREIHISQWLCNVLLFYINTNVHCEKCNHSNDEPFAHEDNMLFSHVKISCFCTKACLEVAWNAFIHQALIFCERKTGTELFFLFVFCRN